MIGRGIDQVLPHSCHPLLHEPYVKNAKVYVELAEALNGPIQKPVSFSYIWGAALEELERVSPDIRLINLETSITKSEDYCVDKAIHYRMNPENIACIAAAQIDCCSLANNHVLDWGYSGLEETLATLKAADIHFSGAGQNLETAEIPAIVEIPKKGRMIIFSFGIESSGIPPEWGAKKHNPGVNLLSNLSDREIQYIRKTIISVKRSGDIATASIHWGSNWGFDIPQEQVEFAHKLIDIAGIDLIHGHSSHHVKGIEIYRDRLIVYGCGDFIDDYEGIQGHEWFRGNLGLMYFATIEPSTGRLIRLQMIPTKIERFKVNRASKSDTLWLIDTLNREGEALGTQVILNYDNSLDLQWKGSS